MTGIAMRATGLLWLVVFFVASLAAGVAGWVGARFEGLEWWAWAALAMAIIVGVAGDRLFSLVASVGLAVPSMAAALVLVWSVDGSEAGFWWASALASGACLVVTLAVARHGRSASQSQP